MPKIATVPSTTARSTPTGLPIRVLHLTGSPIPHLVPLYRLLARDPRVELTVLFASTGGLRPIDMGHGAPVRWDSDLLSGYRSEFLARAERNPVEGSSNLGFLSFRDLDVVPRLIHGRYEVLWLFGYAYLTHVLAATTQVLLRKPILFREDQNLLPVRRPRWKQVLKRLVLPRMMKRFYGLYVGTENRRWMETYGIPQNRLYFTPYCPEAQESSPDGKPLQPRRDEARSQFGISGYAGPLILNVGRLIPKKNPMLLVQAFQRVRADKRCVLLFAGSGELEGEMRSYVDRWKIPDVIFAGFLNRSELPIAYAAADMFVLTSSYRETWGMVVNEAMNFGLPIVVTDHVGCASDLVADGGNGYVVHDADLEALTGRLDLLVRDRELRERMGARSADIIKEWNHDVAVRGVLKAIEDAVGPGRWSDAVGADGV
jgi:glycosyltransferase involved in cell wall biosynthesis